MNKYGEIDLYILEYVVVAAYYPMSEPEPAHGDRIPVSSYYMLQNTKLTAVRREFQKEGISRREQK